MMKSTEDDMRACVTRRAAAIEIAKAYGVAYRVPTGHKQVNIKWNIRDMMKKTAKAVYFNSRASIFSKFY